MERGIFLFSSPPPPHREGTRRAHHGAVALHRAPRSYQLQRAKLAIRKRSDLDTRDVRRVTLPVDSPRSWMIGPP